MKCRPLKSSYLKTTCSFSLRLAFDDKCTERESLHKCSVFKCLMAFFVGNNDGNRIECLTFSAEEGMINHLTESTNLNSFFLSLNILAFFLVAESINRIELFLVVSLTEPLKKVNQPWKRRAQNFSCFASFSLDDKKYLSGLTSRCFF